MSTIGEASGASIPWRIDFSSVASVHSALLRGELSGVNHVFYLGRSLLHVATERGTAEVCAFLLSRGADVLAREALGKSPLWLAASCGKVQVCECLLAHGADVETPGPIGKSPLWQAAACGHVAVCRMLLAHGANLHAATGANETVLSAACGAGWLDLCVLLVGLGASINGITDAPEGSPIVCAIRGGHAAVCTWLVEHGAQWDATTCSDYLRDAAFSNHIVEWLLVRSGSLDTLMARSSRTLIEAATAGHSDMCRRLIAYGADVNWPTVHGFTALQIAIHNGHRDVCAVLLDYGASAAMYEDEDGYSPFSSAAKAGHVSTCQLLVASAAPWPTVAPLPWLSTSMEVYLAAVRDAGWKRRLPAFAAYVAEHGVWWQ